jgi:carboxyl-terminal processing protease
MKFSFAAPFALLFFAGASLSTAVPAAEVRKVAMALENLHYSESRSLDDGKSLEILETYLDNLDPERLYFYREDVEQFRREYGTVLDDEVRFGELRAAGEIYEVFLNRVNDRVGFVKEQIDQVHPEKEKPLDGKRDRKSEWVVGPEEMNPLWKDRLMRELGRRVLRMPEEEKEASRKALKRRYELLSLDVGDKDDDEIKELFLSSACGAYDPHSDYLGPKSMEEFDISMGLRLCGIGAVLTSEDGVAKVESVIPGGPAAKSGGVFKGDRILSITQDGGVPEDIAGLSLEKIVNMIRGEEGTLVHLELAGAEGGGRKLALKREVVQLNDQAVRGAVWKQEGKFFGVLTVPSFYADGEGRSAARDAGAIISKFNEKGVDGMILDLRQDGGGVLDEAVKMAGYFIPGEPVVQIRSPDGGLVVKRAPVSRVSWEKPLLILVDRYSASASEIFSGAIQDHGAGLVAGDSQTFGKGTVQLVMGLEQNPLLKFFGGNGGGEGAVKVTVQKFYRASGKSTQAKGVQSDIVIPSPTDLEEVGESNLPRHLAFDKIPPVRGLEDQNFTELRDFLRSRSLERTSKDPDFARRQVYLRNMHNPGLKGERLERNRKDEEGLLAKGGTVFDSVRGGVVEVTRGIVGSIYEGNPMPRLPDETRDLSLEEGVRIVSDWLDDSSGRELAEAL